MAKLWFKMLPHARCVDVFVKGESARRVAWSVGVSRVRVRGLVISTPSWDFKALSDMKTTLEGLP